MTNDQLKSGLKRMIRSKDPEVSFFATESLKIIQDQERKMIFLEKKLEESYEGRQMTFTKVVD